jgi:glutamate N-acetyltransferase / amino-acid N-acetyltransferase
MTVAEIEVIEVETENVQCPRGFSAGGVACGIKAKGGPDLALILAAKLVSAAALFTTNQVKAAPIVISASHLKASGGKARALLINSGCANAATGEEGRRRTERTVEGLAKLLKCDAREVLVNSTGVIGVQLDDAKILGVLPGLLKQAAPNSLDSAMCAIMTTDTRPKMVQVHVQHDGRTLHVAGIAKGAGMIHPNMATMISVMMTDADVKPRELDGMLRRAADRSFHRITVDGDTSTNDSVFALASGEAGTFPNQLVEDAMTAIARELALMVVKDGEGARKLIHVKVDEARNQREALQIAQTVASSLLVRTAVTGGDPNWGRILAAIGRSGVAIDIAKIRISANDVPLFETGAPADSPLKHRQQAFAADTVFLLISLGSGSAADEFFTCDLTEGYVEVNSHYMT